jgi:hypothetical protein
MPEEEKMTMDERFKYLRLMKKRYLKAGRLERGRLLNEMESVTRLHRKSLIRLMGSGLERKRRHRQRCHLTADNRQGIHTQSGPPTVAELLH